MQTFLGVTDMVGKTVGNWKTFHRIAQDRLKSQELMTSREKKQTERLKRNEQNNGSESWFTSKSFCP